MVNHRPVAGDYTFLAPFAPGQSADDRFDPRELLFNTATHDSDGDAVHLAFVNGQRISPDDSVFTPIRGEYGTLFVKADGEFGYEWDESNPAVQAAEANGGKLVDQFTFKISDGLGGTDFGYFNVATEALTPGTTTIGFEDAKQPDFPDVYKGLSWGLVDDGKPLNLNTTGNHFVYTTANDPMQWQEITTANLQQEVTFQGVDIKTYSTSGTQYGANITFDGYDTDGNMHELTVSIGAGDGNFNMNGATHVDLSSLGPISELDMYYGFPDEAPNSHDNSVLMFDNVTINV